MKNFDAETVGMLRDMREVVIRTDKHPDSAVVIWVVVAEGEVFVRSVRGEKGRWYRDVAAGSPATLDLVGRQLPIRPIPAADPISVNKVSREYLRKYQSSSYAQEMVRADVLPTTLRLEPR